METNACFMVDGRTSSRRISRGSRRKIINGRR
jgi:hypothetical protein